MMRFGVQVEPQFGFSYNDVVEISDKALDNGFEVVWFSDHFMLDADATDRILLDPWLLMAALVRDNEKIRVGSLVFCSSYRNPALHAKMGATIDVLSNGRLEFGIGAGWKKMEYNAYGYEFPEFPTRMKQLSDAIQIIRGAWTDDKFSFSGDHYSVDELVSFPKPVQKPHPTIWVGSNSGGPRMIELAARYGDGINVAWGFDPEKTEEIFSQLSEFAEKHERKPEKILKSVGCWTRILNSESELDENIKKGAATRGISEDDYRKRVASSLWGTPEMVADTLSKYKDQGVSDIILMFPYGEKKEQIEAFGEKVLPLL
jgi:alkanesulfonate monooxygenase SsuD/methylene tetrahydromethanopterin reductase-like flavin-dependent oxidoreductase (luciferase family)